MAVFKILFVSAVAAATLTSLQTFHHLFRGVVRSLNEDVLLDIKERSTLLMVEILKPFGVFQYVHISNEVQTEDGDTLPVAVLVHHRETFFGCHSFEKYFSLKWETVIVLDNEMINKFGILKMAEQAESRGVHVLTLKKGTRNGELLARKIFLTLFKHLQATPPLLLSCHCDIQPLPKWHAMHKPFEAIVSGMVHEFLDEDRMNQQHQQTKVNDYKHAFHQIPFKEPECKDLDKKHRPLLVMNTAMIETIPNTDNLDGSKFHAFETGLSVPWKRRNVHHDLKHQNISWISDVTSWVEDHFALYNTTLLSQHSMLDRFLQVGSSMSSEDRVLAVHMCELGWKAIRLNDEPLFYDLAKTQLYSKVPSSGELVPLHDPKNYKDVSVEWLFARSIRSIPFVNSPFGCIREYMGLRTKVGVNVKTECIVHHRHLQHTHFPRRMWEQPIKNHESLFVALMKFHGYELSKTSDETLTFVQIPVAYSQMHGVFAGHLLAKNPEGVRHGVVGGTEMNYFDVLLNSSFPLDAFFHEDTLEMRFPWRTWDNTTWRGEKMFMAYRKDAQDICAAIRSNHSHVTEGGAVLSPAEAYGILNPLEGYCGEEHFEWTSPLIGFKLSQSATPGKLAS